LILLLFDPHNVARELIIEVRLRRGRILGCGGDAWMIASSGGRAMVHKRRCITAGFNDYRFAGLLASERRRY
jgi:hypothetical protein